LLSSSPVALTKWTPYVVGRAGFAQSTHRRFERWLTHRRIPVLNLNGALRGQVWADFKDRRVYLALDTTMRWDTYGVVYVSLVYRGRMIPLVWKVMAHGSASVAFSDYRSLLMFLRPRLAAYAVCRLADRGFVHRELMAWVRPTRRWHCRIRYQSGIGLYRWDGGRFVPWRWPVDPGRVVCYHSVYVTGGREKVPLAVGWPAGAEAPWAILSDAPTEPETLYEYGWRFHIEEGFLDQQSKGVPVGVVETAGSAGLATVVLRDGGHHAGIDLPGKHRGRGGQPARGRSALVPGS